MKRKSYSYAVVTLNGAGIHGGERGTCAEARRALDRIAKSWTIPGDVFEVQRIEHVSSYARRYQMRQRSRWVEWDPHRGPSVRNPDWVAVS